MKNVFLIFALIIAPISIGQTTVYGKLSDSSYEPIPGATIMLISSQDSILESFGITDGNGIFSLKRAKPGDYILKASFFGHQPYEQKMVVSEQDESINAGEIILKTKTLNAVTIEAEYIPIQIKGDTIEYDSRAFEVKEQDMLEDLLKQLPGVDVGEDGSVSAQGKKVEKITIDGQEFFTNDPALATKNIPANAVEKVQVFDKKSEDSELTGVDEGKGDSKEINIKLKEDKKKGWLGNIDIGGGVESSNQNVFRYKGKANAFYFKEKWQFAVIGMSNNVNENGFTWKDQQNFRGGTKNMMDEDGGGFNRDIQFLPWASSENGFFNSHSTGINLNYKPTKKTTFNSSVFLSVFDQIATNELERETYFSDSTIRTDDNSSRESTRLSNSANLFFKQKFDSTQVLRISLTGSWNQGKSKSVSDLQNFNSDSVLANSFNTNLDGDNLNYNLEGILGYTKKFKKNGRYTSGGVNYSASNSEENTRLDYLNEFFLSVTPLFDEVAQEQSNAERKRTLRVNWMYSEPLSERTLVQLSLGHSRALEKRNREVFDLETGGEQKNDFLSAQGDFLILRNSVSVKHKYLGKKVKTTLTLHVKNFNLSSDSIFSESQRYNYLSPYFNVNWDVKKNTSLRLHYSTYIEAPSLNQLQPLPNNLNPAVIVLGNKNLLPEYYHDLSVSFYRFNEFNFTNLFGRLSGLLVQNNIINSQRINEFFVKEFRPENIGNEKELDLYLGFGFSIYPLKSKFSIRNTGSISNGLINLNGLQDQYTTYRNSSGIVIENIKKKTFDIQATFNLIYGQNTYRDNNLFDTDYMNYNYSFNFEYFLSDRWELGADFSHYFYPQFTTDNQLMILNTKFAVNVLKSRKLQIYLKGRDLLNQNTGLSQVVRQNVYEQERTPTLTRYVLVGLKYSFQKLGSKTK